MSRRLVITVSACFVACIWYLLLRGPGAATVPVPAGSDAPVATREEALKKLKMALPDAVVHWDERQGFPKNIHSTKAFLTGPDGIGGAVSETAARAYPANDPHRAVKAFIDEHRGLFGFDSSVLNEAVVKRDYVNQHNGMRTVVWSQSLDGIPVYSAQILANVTSKGELINIGSAFVPHSQDAVVRGRSPNPETLFDPEGSAAQALAGMIRQENNTQESGAIRHASSTMGKERSQKLTASALKGEATAHLTWMPVSANTLRLSWDIVATVRSTGELHRTVVDAQTYKVLSTMNLTQSFVSRKKAASFSKLSAARTAAENDKPKVFAAPESAPNPMQLAGFAVARSSVGASIKLNVFTSDSPSPFSPAWPTPQNGQPPLVSRMQLTLTALNATASPNGWIDLNNETRGNNVDAHTDTNDDDAPDLPRPKGTGTAPVVFDFPLDLTKEPGTYKSASVTELFYWSNLYHDKMYEFGFTEAAGNFQNDNFGRGGSGNDAVLADAQDGGGVDNANFSTPPDGAPGRMQMYLFDGTVPGRDGDLDATVILHELTHGLSNRLVGGGVGIDALQPSGMGEGWSDFYALSLLSDPADDVNGTYPVGAYVIGGLLSSNYYYGIRRYPYCREPNSVVTANSKNPLTFGDIVVNNEVHDAGEVWCTALWEVRARLIDKYLGSATDANRLMLQLVTDGMKLAPANPTFLQARDAILQADLVNNGGANRGDIWIGFAKRGMGFNAIAGTADSTSGVVEAFDLPGDLTVTPIQDFNASGRPGGPFLGSSKTYTLTNNNNSLSIDWTASVTQPWLNLSQTSGTLAPNASTTVTASLTAVASSLALGNFTDTITFTNTTNGSGNQTRMANLSVEIHPPIVVDDFDPDTDANQWSVITGVANTFFAPSSPTATGKSLWFDNDGDRVATTVPMDTTGGGMIKFSLIIGQTDYPTEHADSGENIVLEYTTDGVTYTIIDTYSTLVVTTWTAFTIPIPAAAKTYSTQFRWRQVAHSGSGFDNWALDNVMIGMQDSIPPTVTVNQAVGQADPTKLGSISFTAQFSEVVAGFTNASVTLGGTALPETATVYGNGATYTIVVTGMSQPGTVIVSIAAGKVADYAGNPNLASTSTDNTVTYALPANIVWTGGSSVSNNWTDGQNWGGTPPAPGDNVIFAGVNRLSPVNNFPAGTIFNSVTFNAGGFNVTGSSVQLLAGTPVLNNAGTNSLGLNITLQESFTTPTYTLSVVAGVLNLNGTVLANAPLTVAAAGACNANGALSGSGTLTKTGTGSLTLNAVNSYAPSTTLSGGTLRFGIANALPANSSLSTALGTQVDFSNGIGSFGQSISTLTGSGTVTNSGGTLVTYTDTGASGGDFSGSFTGALNYVKTGIGTNTWSGASSYTGSTTLTAGILSISNATALGAGSNGTLINGGTLLVSSNLTLAEPITVSSGTISATLGATLTGGLSLTGAAAVQCDAGTLSVNSLAGTGALTKNGPGTVSLAASGGYSGPMTVSAGALNIGAIFASSPINVSSSGTLMGTGKVGNVTLTGGTLAPSPGVLSTGNISCTSASQILLTLNGSQAGTFSQLDVAGTVALNGCALTTVGGGGLSLGTSVQVIVNNGTDAIDGYFSNVKEGGVTNTSLRATFQGGTGNDLELVRVNAGGGTIFYSNPAQITIPSAGSATPYPSTINVSGFAGNSAKVTVTLNSFNHSFPADVDVLLVAPGGQCIFLMSAAGTSLNVTDVTMTFDDAASKSLPEDAVLMSGTYKPTRLSSRTVPSPAPAVQPTGTALSTFNGVSPNGIWSLYVYDQEDGDSGAFVTGWSLKITSDILPPISFASLLTNNTSIFENASITLSGVIADPITHTHTLTIDWADGSPISIVDLPSGTLNFNLPAHNYLDDTPTGTSQDDYTITATVFDGQNVATGSVVLTVANVPPANVTANLNQSTINEGSTVTLSGSFTDPGTLDTHTVSIDWGDGGTSTLQLTTGARTYSTTHLYADNNVTPGPYTISVIVKDDDMGSGTALTAVTVNNVLPIVTASGASVIGEGATFTLSGTITDPGLLDEFTLEIDWGDGSPHTISDLSGGTTTYSEDHQYANDRLANYVIHVTLTDSDNGVGMAMTSVKVNNVAPTAEIGGIPDPAVANEGDSIELVSMVNEPGMLDVLTYAWTVTKNGLPYLTASTADLSFVPDDNGVYVVKLTVSDDGGGTVIAPTQTLTILNVSPEATILGAPSQLHRNVAVPLSSGVSDAGAADTFTYLWSVTLNGVNFASATSQNFSFTPSSNGVYEVNLYIFDDDGGLGSDSIRYVNLDSLAIGSPLTATPNPAQAGTPVMFSSAVLYSVNVSWHFDFGDGTSFTGPVGAATHTYYTAGTYFVMVTTTDSSSNSVTQTLDLAVKLPPGSGVEIDSDGDGFSDALEIGAGTDPFDAGSTPIGDLPAQPEALTIASLSVTLDFKKQNNDSLAIKGRLPYPAGFVSTGQKVLVDVGNAVVTCTLNSKGSAKIGKKGSFKFSKPSSGSAAFALALKAASLRAVLDGDGLSNETVQNKPVVLPVTILFNQHMYKTSLVQFYNATKGVKGIFKYP